MSGSKDYVGVGKCGDFCVLAGSANLELAEEVAAAVGVSLTPVLVKQFADKEVCVRTYAWTSVGSPLAICGEE